MYKRQVSLIFNGWYEVEDDAPFEEGDWVLNKANMKEYAEVQREKDIYTLSIKLQGSDQSMIVKKRDVSKVTEPWKIELLKLGRNSPSLKRGDVLISDSGSIFVNEDDESVEKTHKMLEGGNTIFFYPVEKSINLK